VQLEAFAVALEDPLDAYHGERGDKVAIGFDLEWEATAPIYRYPVLARYEQSCKVSGEILIGNEAIDFTGFGQRDHSWGVRDWWTTGWIWTAGRLDDGTAFHALKVHTDRFDFEPGYVVREGELTPLRGFKPTFAPDPDTGLPGETAMPLDDLVMTASPVAFAPLLLEAPDGRVARFPRGLCRFSTADGRAGYGWTEWSRPPA
jgi:hypothetical protein